MFKKINFWAFILSLLCIILLYYLTQFSVRIENLLLGIHPLKIVLIITLTTLLLGTLGVVGINDWKSKLRSIFTLLTTFVLAAFLTYVVFWGSLFDAL